MKAAVITFPGSNADRDLYIGLSQSGADVSMLWHKETELPTGLDLIALPGGFSFGDYLRCGAISVHSPIMPAVIEFARKGGYLMGVCNGFQILCEAGLLPGALLRNRKLKFISKLAVLKVEQSVFPFTSGYRTGEEIQIPIAHHDGNYFAPEADLDRLEGEGRVVLRYQDNPNGSQRNIAGILSENRRVIGMMPHPERALDTVHVSDHGEKMFKTLSELAEITA